jgi:hypothetical protein
MGSVDTGACCSKNRQQLQPCASKEAQDALQYHLPQQAPFLRNTSGKPHQQCQQVLQQLPLTTKSTSALQVSSTCSA